MPKVSRPKKNKIECKVIQDYNKDNNEWLSAKLEKELKKLMIVEHKILQKEREEFKKKLEIDRAKWEEIIEDLKKEEHEKIIKRYPTVREKYLIKFIILSIAFLAVFLLIILKIISKAIQKWKRDQTYYATIE